MIYRGEIDGLRAIAVLTVVLYHYGFPGITGGFVGVDVFFVISGFLITSIVHEEVKAGTFTFMSFYERRVRRILPALFAVLAFTLAAGLFISLPSDLNGMARAGFFAALFSSNIFFNFDINYFNPEAAQSPLIHTWSLAVEEQFYIFMPVIVAVIGRINLRWLFPAVIVLALASLGWSAFAISFDPQGTFYLLPSRAWELLAGSALALALRPKQGSQLASVIGVAGVGLILAACVLYTHDTPFPGLTALLPVIGSMAVIHASNAGGGVAGRLLAFKPVAFVGKVSYSWYLWHWPLIAFYHYLGFSDDAPAPKAALFLLSFALAVASWRFIEQPFRRHRKADGKPRPLKPVAIGAAGSVFAAAAFGFIAWRDGLPERLNPTVLAFETARHDWPETSSYCNQRSVEEARAGDVCHAGIEDESVAPSFAVIGDSHGDVLWPSLSRVAKAAGERGIVFTRSGCPPVLTGINPDKGCDDYMNAALAYVASQPSIRRVVLIGRWGYFVGPRSTRSEVFNFDGPTSGRRDEYAENFERGLAATRARLGGREIIAMRPLPTMAFAPTRQLALSYWLGAPGVNPIDAEEYRREMAPVDAILARSGVRVLDIEPVLCNAKTCDIVRDDKSIYADSNHVTQHGASLFDPLFAKVFTETHE